ncbi:hypothetical protein OV203_12600 [Nannocystis sp. ILAH1]|uniref:hypothetical protein n=1 Tax=unclassified Nannocystis TaxID=2627009 RepID=UPI00226FDE6A|nr:MULTISPECIES: hypothetical protein [unclassified Nannocystis]MCY0987970.1 hypothetical protein [Nannocystis sp. ILAH1]MCY1065687.1 hypothetical protein [Nannocystis sp. RBIL2]
MSSCSWASFPSAAAGTLAGLGVREVEEGVLPVDHGPLEVQDLVASQAGEREELQCPDGHRLDVTAGGWATPQPFLEDGLKIAALLRGQEALDLA